MKFEAFETTARGLAKNPLGIIAMFLLLVYGFAAMLLATGGPNVDENQRFLLTLFLVIFPFVVLGAFYLLVTRHHAKLYAPGDYRDEKLFVRSLSPEEQRFKLSSEVAETEDRAIVSTPLGLKEEQRTDYFLAKDLALRELEVELGIPFKRHVVITSPRRDLAFDGVAERETDVLVADVKYLPTTDTRLTSIQSTQQRILEAAKYLRRIDAGIALMPFVAVVFGQLQDDERSGAERRLRAAVRMTNVELRIYNLANLKKQYDLDVAMLDLPEKPSVVRGRGPGA